MPKLLSIKKANDGIHKYVATFEMENGRTRTTRFGAEGMDDYTIKGDKEQRDRYRTRHAKDLKSGDPTRAGYLSYYVLWGDSTSLRANIASYRNKFNL
jgi:hypothetical protein